MKTKFSFLLLEAFKAKYIHSVIFLNAIIIYLGCAGCKVEERQGNRNSIEAYRVTWWHLPVIEGSKTGNFGRPDYGIINIDNGELNLRHAILEGRDLGDYRLPYWPIRSFVSIFNNSTEIAHRCTLNATINNKKETFPFRTGNPEFKLNSMSSKRVGEGFELARIKNADVLKITNKSSDSPILMEHFFVIEKGSRSIPIFIKATNTTDKKIQNVEVGVSYCQDFNWSSFGVSNDKNYRQTDAPDTGSAEAFYAFSSGMGSGFEFQQNKGCELSYQMKKSFNVWNVSIKNTPVSLEPGGSFIFSYNLSIINKPLKQMTQTRFISENELELLEFRSKIPRETRTAPVDTTKRVTIQDVIQNLEKPKVRGLSYIGGSTAFNDLALLKDWGGNLAFSRSDEPALIVRGKEFGMEMFITGMGSYKTGEPMSLDDFFVNEIKSEGYPDSYGQDEDHYYWYPVKPTLDFEREFGKLMSEATLEEKVAYWSLCFVNKWRMQLDHVRKHDPKGNIWFYNPSPGMPHVDPFDYYDLFFSEISKLGETLTVFPFYYGIDYDMVEYMVRRWKDAGIQRVVFLPGGPTYAKPSQFVHAITSARRGGADGTCGFLFSVTEEDFDDEWRWKSIMLASHANFPTPELDAFCFMEEPVRLIEALAISEVNVITGKSDAEDLTEKLEAFFPGRVKRLEKLPESQHSGQIYLVVGENRNAEQYNFPYDIRHLKPGKGVLQMSGKILKINGADATGLQNAKELFFRFAEMGLAESKCYQQIKASELKIDN